MTPKEFAVLVAAMKNYYPTETLLPTSDAVKLWYEALKDIPYDVASAALLKYTQTNRFSPTIADIREQASLITDGEMPDWGEGWNEVTMAISRYGMYREAEALRSMSPLTRQVVQRLGFQNLCLSENQMADRANFRQIHEQLASRQKTQNVMSDGLKDLIAMVGSPERLTQKERDALEVHE